MTVESKKFDWSWRSCSFKEGADNLEYITALSFTVTREIGKVYGQGAKKRGRTGGQIDATGSITWWSSRLAELRATRPKFADYPFTPTLQRQLPSGAIVPVVFEDCLITEFGEDFQIGPDQNVVVTPVDIMDVIYNGVSIFGDEDLLDELFNEAA